MKSEISSNDKYIDSRDIIARIEELRAMDEPGQEELEELVLLDKLANECEQYCDDWIYGAQLIRYDYFKAYAQEYAQELAEGTINKGAGWPYNCIDWVEAARELAADYYEVEFGDITYYVR